MILRNVELWKLQHVVALARAGSFVKAAEELRLTQSALTRSIQSLEKRFGVRLFDRERSGVRLTAIGREVLQRAESLLLDSADVTRFLERAAKGDVGEVSFGLTALPAKLFLAPMMLELFATKPNLRCSVAVRSPADLLERLTSDRIEFFLAGHVPESPNVPLSTSSLLNVSSVLAVRAGHPLLRRANLALEDLAPYPVVVSLIEALAPAGRSILDSRRASLRSDDYASLLRITLNSDAIWSTAMPPHSSAAAELGLTILPPVRAVEHSNFVLQAVQLARRTLSPAAQEVLDDLTRRCAEVAAGDVAGVLLSATSSH
jgi:DNA-binding transcriptional LysR family regulator